MIEFKRGKEWGIPNKLGFVIRFGFSFVGELLLAYFAKRNILSRYRIYKIKKFKLFFKTITNPPSFEPDIDLSILFKEDFDDNNLLFALLAFF